MTFKDHFSGQPEHYQRYRPHYPDSLFDWLASISPGTNLAWDCATGNGQAAHQLARHFDKVIATDGSEQQISQAVLADNIDYAIARETHPGLATSSVDLITVAQALHWFDLPLFFSEAERILNASGVLAVWSYNLLSINSQIDAVVNDFYHNTLGEYWPAERRLIEEGYKSIQLPFAEISAPDFQMSQTWQPNHLIGYLGTWSAVKNYRLDKQEDPLVPLSASLKIKWPDNQAKQVKWPLTLRVAIKGA